MAPKDIERDACGKCASCKRIARGVHPDVIIVEPGDTGTIKIEQVRDIVDRAGYRPFEGRRRVVVIEDRKSTRLNSSHGYISYAVFCLKKKNNCEAGIQTTR